jgi:hypothetical protein
LNFLQPNIHDLWPGIRHHLNILFYFALNEKLTGQKAPLENRLDMVARAHSNGDIVLVSEIDQQFLNLNQASTQAPERADCLWESPHTTELTKPRRPSDELSRQLLCCWSWAPCA